MKKILKFTLVTILLFAVAGTCIWFVFGRNNKSLYKANSDFILHKDTQTLELLMTEAQTLHNTVSPTDRRVEVLKIVINKINSFEQDLNVYLITSTAKANSTKKLSNTYSSLTKIRTSLIKDYNEYITRMSGDTQADGPMTAKIYNDIFNKTVEFLRKYNNCFKSTSDYVFDKICKFDNIKTEIYTLYSAGVNNLLNNISNNQFSTLSLINRLNSGIRLDSTNNIVIKNSAKGGEFNVAALNFKKHFNNSDINNLVQNFNTYYNETIDISTETSNEKLAVYYAKQILEV